MGLEPDVVCEVDEDEDDEEPADVAAGTSSATAGGAAEEEEDEALEARRETMAIGGAGGSTVSPASDRYQNLVAPTHHWSQGGVTSPSRQSSVRTIRTPPSGSWTAVARWPSSLVGSGAGRPSWDGPGS